MGGYCGSFRDPWLKVALLLKEGAVVVLPTDTIYGICTSAFKRESVERVYSLRKRSPEKPCIILIEKIADLSLFGIRLKEAQKEILNQLWPGKVSVVLTISSSKKIKELHYLHRGTNSLAFRVPKPKFLRDILKISGPLIAPSANPEGQEPAKTILQAKKYFGEKVVYFDKGELEGNPSTLIRLTGENVEVLRKGSGWQKVERLLGSSKNFKMAPWGGFEPPT